MWNNDLIPRTYDVAVVKQHKKVKNAWKFIFNKTRPLFGNTKYPYVKWMEDGPIPLSMKVINIT